MYRNTFFISCKPEKGVSMQMGKEENLICKTNFRQGLDLKSCNARSVEIKSGQFISKSVKEKNCPQISRMYFNVKCILYQNKMWIYYKKIK